MIDQKIVEEIKESNLRHRGPEFPADADIDFGLLETFYNHYKFVSDSDISKIDGKIDESVNSFDSGISIPKFDSKEDFVEKSKKVWVYKRACMSWAYDRTERHKRNCMK